MYKTASRFAQSRRERLARTSSKYYGIFSSKNSNTKSSKKKKDKRKKVTVAALKKPSKNQNVDKPLLNDDAQLTRDVIARRLAALGRVVRRVR